MRIFLAWASLRRRPGRTLLAILGVAVSAAMLLDMVMLAGGMRESFRSLLDSRGFEIRLSPRGTLPFDTEATIPGSSAIIGRLAQHPDIKTVSPVLGGALHFPGGETRGNITSIGLGVDPQLQGDYTILEGAEGGERSIVINEALASALDAKVGDSIRVAVGYDPQLRSHAGEIAVQVSAIGRFFYLSAGQLAAAMPLPALQRMHEGSRDDRVSLIMLALRDGASIEAVTVDLRNSFPSVTVTSTAEALAQVDQRLGYFRQLAAILGGVSLVVGFLLVTTLMTVSVSERSAEIAVMRAIGVSRLHIVQQILLEGLVIAIAGAVAGLALGLVTARWLETILASFPGLPEAISFFLFQPRDAWTALGMLVVTGVAAGAYPAWRGASLPIAATMRREAVA